MLRHAILGSLAFATLTGCAARAPTVAPVATAAAATVAADSDSDAGYRDARRELALARTAYDAKDLPSFLQHAERAAARAPELVAALYTLACAQALAGHADVAAAALRRLAAARVYFDVAADSDFDGVRASPAFTAARQALDAVRVTTVGHSDVAFTLPERDLVTEGLAFDRQSGAFFVSSVHKRKIVRVARDGQVTDFITSGRDGVWALFALAVDPARGSLLALSAPTPEMLGYDPGQAGATGVFEYDLATAALRRKVLLPPQPEPRTFNDLVLAPDGTAYISDGRTGAIVTLAAGATELRPFLPAGVLTSAQGLAFAADGKSLFVADYARGLARIDLATRAVHFLAAPRDTTLVGIDALVADGAQLIATQNGVRPARVVRLRPSVAGDRIEAATLLELNDARVEEPTLGTLVGRDFYYIANSQWGSFDRDGHMWPWSKLKDPMVLKTRVD